MGIVEEFVRHAAIAAGPCESTVPRPRRGPGAVRRAVRGPGSDARDWAEPSLPPCRRLRPATWAAGSAPRRPSCTTVISLNTAQRLGTARHLDGAPRGGVVVRSARSPSPSGASTSMTTGAVRQPGCSDVPAVCTDGLQGESEPLDAGHHLRQGTGDRPNVRDHVTVLTDLRRDLSVLDRVQQHHLPADESPRHIQTGRRGRGACATTRRPVRGRSGSSTTTVIRGTVRVANWPAVHPDARHPQRRHEALLPQGGPLPARRLRPSHVPRGPRRRTARPRSEHGP